MRALSVVLIALCIFLAACAPATPPTLPAGWSPVVVVAETSPQLRLALAVGDGHPIIAWHEGGALIVRRSERSAAKTVATTHDPRQLSIFDDGAGGANLLWLDALDPAKPADSRLYLAHLSADLSLIGAPTAISTLSTIDYAAIRLAPGGLLTVWTGHTSPEAVDLLDIQIIDLKGHAQPPTLIARDAAHPALTIDAAGTVVAAWLTANTARIWTIQVAALGADPGSLSAPPLPTAIGVIAVAPTQIIESLALGADQLSLYAIWGVADSLSGDGAIDALSFASRDPTHGVQFRVADHARWPSPANGSALAIGLTQITEAGSRAAVVFVAPGKVTRIDPISDSVAATVERLTLTSDSAKVWAVWPSLDDRGTTRLNLTGFQ